MEKTVLVATHNGMFHPDDVFAVAVLLKVLELLPVKIRVERTRDESKIISADFVVDVGGVYDAEKSRFDHHQIGGAGKRENGIPYASFGLVWLKFGEKLSGSAEAAAIVEKRLVMPIDASDNGQDIFTGAQKEVLPYLAEDFIYSLRPTWLEGSKEIDENFSKAVAFARGVIEREIKVAEAIFLGKRKVLEAYEKSEDKRIVILDNYYPWQEVLVELPETIFAIFPRIDGKGWNVKAVRDTVASFKNRKKFPENWAGKRNSELASVSGVPDAVFCHAGRFMAVAHSREGAVALAAKALVV